MKGTMNKSDLELLLKRTQTAGLSHRKGLLWATAGRRESHPQETDISLQGLGRNRDLKLGAMHPPFAESKIFGFEP